MRGSLILAFGWFGFGVLGGLGDRTLIFDYFGCEMKNSGLGFQGLIILTKCQRSRLIVV